jgi:predicted DNA-binding transcriptional regulator AlpA
VIFLLDAHEAAAFLGVSLRKFRDLTKEPSFPAGRVLGPRSTRWVRSELEVWAIALPLAARDEPEQLRRSRCEPGVPEPFNRGGRKK